MNDANNELSISDGSKPVWLEIVRQQVVSLRYGVVQIVVHDSRITQIDKTERVRLEKTRAEIIKQI
jgi:hypothetical protein